MYFHTITSQQNCSVLIGGIFIKIQMWRWGPPFLCYLLILQPSLRRPFHWGSTLFSGRGGGRQRQERQDGAGGGGFVVVAVGLGVDRVPGLLQENNEPFLLLFPSRVPFGKSEEKR